MAVKKVVPGSLTDAYKLREGDFAPNLVGNQFTDPNAFFTLGNFEITSNFNGRVSKDFTLGEWSEYYCLKNLDITEEELEEAVNNNIFVKLNFDTTIVDKYVYFGSFSKTLETEIQDIILKWPASLYISTNPIVPSNTRPSSLNTILDFYYNPITKTSSFKSPVKAVTNQYNLVYDNNPFIENTITNQLSEYILSNENNDEFTILGMTGLTNDSNYIYFKIDGNPFTTLSATTFGTNNYHIKPIKKSRDYFFNNLSDVQKIILNRLTTPKYTLIIDVPIVYNDGDIGFAKQSFTWPTTDGYNLDIITIPYSDYIEQVFKVSELYDENKTNLMTRRLVSESIIEYDTEGDGNGNDGRRVHKLLTIYGTEFDVVKKYIDGISFANVVTYNKKDNTSDSLIKIMAKTLGFDVLLTVNDGVSILTNNDEGDDPQFEGYSRELSPNQIDIELWRRLVINAWWLFRSKGTRKVLEFFMQLFSIKNCLVTMDERIYLAKDKLDLNELRKQFNTLFGPSYYDLNRNNFPVDDYGFPKTPNNTETFWFQNDGFWYNGGNEIVTGNNPHYGPYDFGQRYWDKFRCFVDDFQSSVNLINTEINFKNYFNDFNNGTFTPDANGPAFSYYNEGNVPEFFINPDDNIDVVSAGLVEFGTPEGPTNVRDSGDTYSLRVTFQAGESELCGGCPPETAFAPNGVIYITSPDGKSIPHNIEECCEYYWLAENPNQNNENSDCPNNFTITPNNPYVTITSDVGNPLSQQCCYEYFTQLSNEEQSIGVSWNSTIGCYYGTDEPVTPGDGVVDGGNGGDGDVIIIDGTDGNVPNETTPNCDLTFSQGSITGVGGILTTSSDCGGDNIIFKDVPKTEYSGSGSAPATAQFTIDAPTASVVNPVTLTITTKGPISGIDSTASQPGIFYQLKQLPPSPGPLPQVVFSDFKNPYQTLTFDILLDTAGPTTYIMEVYPYNSSDNYFEVCTDCGQLTEESTTRQLGEVDLVTLPGRPTTGGEILDEIDSSVYYCWWCPPENNLLLICNSEEYLNNLSLNENGLLSLANTYGYENNDPVEAENFLINIFNTYFKQNKCIYMIGNQVLKNENCCVLRGGTWNNELQLCEIIQDIDNCNRENVTTLYNSVVGINTDPTQPELTEINFEMLDQNCCETLGYSYGIPNVQIQRLDGTIDYAVNSSLVSVYLDSINSPRFGCFECDRTFKETTASTNNGTTIIYLTDSDDNYLTQNCCQKYGPQYNFSSQQVLIENENGEFIDVNLCTRCNPENLIVNTQSNTVTNVNGQNIDQSCCESGGFFFQEEADPTNGLEVGCYQCPPFVDGNYITQQIIFGGTPVGVYTDSNGNQLSEECCSYLDVAGNFAGKLAWANDARGCYLI